MTKPNKHTKNRRNGRKYSPSLWSYIVRTLHRAEIEERNHQQQAKEQNEKQNHDHIQ